MAAFSDVKYFLLHVSALYLLVIPPPLKFTDKLNPIRTKKVIQ